MRSLDFIFNSETNAFIKRYSHLIFLLTASWIFTPYNIFSLRLLGCLLIMFLTVDLIAIDELCKHFKETGKYTTCFDISNGGFWCRTNSWTIILGFIPPILGGFMINNLVWWIIEVPHNTFVMLKIKNNNFRMEETQ